MKKPKPRKAKKLRRNPHAKALATTLYRARIERAPGDYQRRPKHRKPAEEET